MRYGPLPTHQTPGADATMTKYGWYLGQNPSDTQFRRRWRELAVNLAMGDGGVISLPKRVGRPKSRGIIWAPGDAVLGQFSTIRWDSRIYILGRTEDYLKAANPHIAV